MEQQTSIPPIDPNTKAGVSRVPGRAPKIADASVIEFDEVARAQEVDPAEGLTAAAASERLELHGRNELTPKRRESALRRLVRQFADPLVYLLLAAVVVSTLAWLAEGAEGLPVDALVILVILVANAALGYVQENKAEDAVAALADMTATHATVLREGLLVDVPAAELVPGDVLVLAEGDAVGADARLFSSSNLLVQESSLTGESEAIDKDPAVLPSTVAIGDRRNMVFKGTAVVRGVGRAVVTATGMGTEIGHIATLLEATKDQPTPLQVEIARISRALGVLVIVIAVLVMGVIAGVNGISSLDEAVDVLLLGVSLAVAAVPEGLPAILSLVLAIGVQAMARQNAVLKNLHSAETLGSVSVICSDKTGTLTKNEMTLKEIVTASGRVLLGGSGYNPAGDVVVSGERSAAIREARRVITGGALANNAQLAQVDGVWEIQGDPTEAAFLVAQHKLAGVTERVNRYSLTAQVPFTSERKLMSVLGTHEAKRVNRVFVKGAPEVLLKRCVSEQVSRDAVPLTPARRAELEETIAGLSRQGYRTLGVAWRDISPTEAVAFDEDAEHDLVLAGIAAIIDPPRPEAVAAIADAHRAGVRVVMITGDHPVTAGRIASDLGLVAGQSPVVLTGEQIDTLDEASLTQRTREASVYARVSPEHKLRIVDALQADRQIVAMTGDGVNDAPALKSADIGIAMGVSGTEVTKDAATMILGDDNFATIVAAVRQGRVIFDNIRKFLRYLLSSNTGEVATVFLGVTLGGVIGLADPANPAATVVPLLATQILWINLVTDSGPALAMGVDPELDDVMARPPRRFDDRIIDRRMWQRIIRVGLVMGLVGLAVFDMTLPGGLVGGFEHLATPEDQWAVSRTTVFTSLVFMQLFNALNSRSDLGSAFHHLFTNKWLWLSLALAVVAQVIVVQAPLLQRAFGTTSLDAAHWLIAVAAGLSVLVVEEVVKAFRRWGVRRVAGSA